ncbi:MULTISPECIES: hypothetical protein [unclassified Kribbella]|uniref:hypothetical protein n=1 Tax=unclassified Kribbella TaxID=2644121 RepID=UPI0033DCA00D
MSAVLVLILVAGLSEAAGRVLPLVARRPSMSHFHVIGLLLTGALVEATVIALWPVTAAALAELATEGAVELSWTAGLVAPLVLAAILAFPMLGPALHLLLLIGVGAGLTGHLADASGLSWGASALCVAVAGFGLALAVDLVRRLVAALIAIRMPEPVA